VNEAVKKWIEDPETPPPNLDQWFGPMERMCPPTAGCTTCNLRRDYGESTRRRRRQELQDLHPKPPIQQQQQELSSTPNYQALKEVMLQALQNEEIFSTKLEPILATFVDKTELVSLFRAIMMEIQEEASIKRNVKEKATALLSLCNMTSLGMLISIQGLCSLMGYYYHMPNESYCNISIPDNDDDDDSDSSSFPITESHHVTQESHHVQQEPDDETLDDEMAYISIILPCLIPSHLV
jgi:hypothetical protein